MRDKALYRGWVGSKTAEAKEELLFYREGDCVVLLWVPTFSSNSVLVSIQGGVKMSTDEFLSFFDRTITWGGQKTQFLEMSKRELDTICAAGSLFKGTVVDFGDFCSHSGGGNYANNSAVN